MGWTDQVDAYCERLGPGPLAEPLNALSNLGFFVAAWGLWRRAEGAAPGQRGLALLVALVGAGSLSFHSLATRWAGVLDVAFIGLFELAFLMLFLRSVARWPGAGVAAAGLGFLVLDRTAAALIPADRYNGSVLYLPAVVVLLTLTTYARRIAPEAGRRMTRASGVFAVSLAARTADLALCPVWPWGTHCVWHLLNAWILYQLGQAIAPAPRRS